MRSIRALVHRRPAMAMAAGTMASRATGLLRTVALAWALGLGPVADAYNVANTIPMMLFTLVVGGPLTASLVPLLATEEGESQRRAANAILSVVVGAGVMAGLAVAVLAPTLIALLAPGARALEDQAAFFDLAGRWLLLFAAQVPLYALSVFATGALTANGRLGLGAVAPVATNVIVIGAALWFGSGRGESIPGLDEPRVLVLGLGTTTAVAAMAVIQFWGARRVIPGLRPTFDLSHPAVRTLPRLGGWVVLYVSTNQIGLAVVTALASSVSGGISAYQWAFATMQLPYAIVVVSIISAATPRVARAAPDGVHPYVSRAASQTLALMAPAAAALAIGAGEIATLLAGPGTELLADAVRGFALSLVPFSLFQVLARASYARRNTRSPALVNIGVNVVNVVCAVGLLAVVESPGRRVFALAVSHAASYVAGCLLLGWSLHRQLGRVVLLDAGLARGVAAAAIALLLCAASTGTGSTSTVPGALALLGVRGVLTGLVSAVLLLGFFRRAPRDPDAEEVSASTPA